MAKPQRPIQKLVQIPVIGGMNNVALRGSLDRPRVILNMDVFESGYAKQRTGLTALSTGIVTCSSLYAVNNKYMLVVGGGGTYSFSLWKLYIDGTKVELSEVIGGNAVSYVTVGYKIYMSSKSWKKVFNTLTETLEEWGVDIPAEAPSLSIVAGAMPAGKYGVVFTRLASDGRLSGTSDISYITLSSDGAIAVLNTASDLIVWATGPDGAEFFFSMGSVINGNIGAERISSFGAEPPGFMENLVISGGRIWGSRGKKVYYSRPYGYEWFDRDGFLEFHEDITMIAPLPNQSLFIHTENDTFYLSSSNPTESVAIRVADGDGAIPGTLGFARLSEKDEKVPFWASKSGILLGSSGGSVQRVTQGKVRFDGVGKGASLFRQIEGQPQLLSAFEQGSVSNFSDTVTADIIRNGVLYTGIYEDKSWSDIKLQETVTLEVNP